MAGVVATLSSGLLILASAQAELMPVWLAIQVLRLADHFKQICETEVPHLCLPPDLIQESILR